MTSPERRGDAARSHRLRFFATAAKGTEPALRDELREGHFGGVRADRGGVHFEGSFETGMRACFELRVAMRVLLDLGSWDAPDEGSLYEGVRALDLRSLATPRQTIAVRANCSSSALTHSQFVAQKTKDAIVDGQRLCFGGRSSVDRDAPDVLFSLRLARDRATLYADMSGAPLHMRGYRTTPSEAPLKETLAAGLLRLAGWDCRAPLVDPMCGSATLPIEAWLWSRGVPPLFARERFGFEGFAGHDDSRRRAASSLREAARAAHADATRRASEPWIAGRDADPRAIEHARSAAREAGAEIDLQIERIEQLARVPPGAWVIVNPPYGERISANPQLFAALGRVASQLVRAGSRVAVLAGTPAIPRSIPLRPARALAVYNGAIECRLLIYEPSSA